MADNSPNASPRLHQQGLPRNLDTRTIAHLQEEEQLRLIADLLPSPPTHPLGHRPPWSAPTAMSAGVKATPGIAPGIFRVTVDDLKNKVCWICQEGEEDEINRAPAASQSWSVAARRDEAASPGRYSNANPTARPSRPPKRSSRFVHPCKCTLVAHEYCLLLWIHRKRTATSPDVKCPQCSEVFALESPRPLILRLFEVVDRFFTASIPIAGVWVAVGASLFLSGAFGALALRLWMGKPAAQRWLGYRSWPRIAYVILPTIAPLLVTSRFHVMNGLVIDGLWSGVVTPLICEQAVLFQLSGDTLSFRRSSLLSYPPSPQVTLLLLPSFRALYFVLRRRFTRWLLAPFIKKAAGSASGSPGGQHPDLRAAARASPRAARQRRVIIVGGEENHLVDADAEQDGPLPPGVQAIVNEAAPEAAQRDDNDEFGQQGLLEEHEVFNNPAVDGLARREVRMVTNQTIYVTPTSLLRLVLGSLSFPLIAAGTGELLGLLASFTRPGSALEKFLGITDETRIQWMPHQRIQIGHERHRSSATTVVHLPSDTLWGRWMSWGAGNLAPSANSRSQDVAQAPVQGSTYKGYREPPSADAAWMETDVRKHSVHWRNTLGLFMYIIVSDACSLGYRYLRLRQRTVTRVVDRPFYGEALIRGLDLK